MKLGHAASIEINITEPMKMDHALDFNALTLMAGLNGTGKSFINKLTWIMDSCTNLFIISPGNDEAKKGVMQFYFNNTFADNNVDGIIKYSYEGDTYLEVRLQAGVVINVETHLSPQYEPGGHPMYLSTNMRLMTQLTQYMKTKKLLNIPTGIPEKEDDMVNLLGMYKLYDILFAETLIRYVSTITTEQVERFVAATTKMDEKLTVNIKGLKVDTEQCDIKYKDKDELWLSVATLGAGHQALMTMLLMSGLQPSTLEQPST